MTDLPIGFPDGPQFARKQQQLIERLNCQWGWLVGEILHQCGDVFAQEVP